MHHQEGKISLLSQTLFLPWSRWQPQERELPSVVTSADAREAKDTGRNAGLLSKAKSSTPTWQTRYYTAWIEIVSYPSFLLYSLQAAQANVKGRKDSSHLLRLSLNRVSPQAAELSSGPSHNSRWTSAALFTNCPSFAYCYYKLPATIHPGSEYPHLKISRSLGVLWCTWWLPDVLWINGATSHFWWGRESCSFVSISRT